MSTRVNPIEFLQRRFGPDFTVAFMPNGGNLGDGLIASATMQAFDKAKIDWRILRGGRENIRPTDILVHGGGGSLVKLYEGTVASLKFMATLNRPIVVFPQTVRNHSEFWQNCGAMTVFCRDPTSLAYIQQFTHVESYLCDDMAVMLDVSSPPFSCVAELRRRILTNNVPKSTLNIFRSDGESSGNSFSDVSFDLSDIAYPTMKSQGEIDAHTVFFMTAIAGADLIQTDRLHVAVAAGLLNIPTNFFDNSYGKNRGVYEFTIRDRFPSINFVSNEP